MNYKVDDKQMIDSQANSQYTACKTSRLAIASLALRILAGIPAIILGIIAVVKIRRNGAILKGKGLAIAGIAIATSFILLLVLEIIIVSS